MDGITGGTVWSVMMDLSMGGIFDMGGYPGNSNVREEGHEFATHVV